MHKRKFREGMRHTTWPREPEAEAEPWAKFHDKPSPLPKAVSFVMYLDDGRVAKRFGPRPHLGCKLPFAGKQVTVGIKWSLPKKDFIPDEKVMVQPAVTLKCLKRGKWLVTVEETYRQRTVDFLFDNCM